MLHLRSSLIFAFHFAILSTSVLASPLPLAPNDSAATLAAPANLEKGDFRISRLLQTSTLTRWLNVTQPVKMGRTIIVYPVPDTTTKLVIDMRENKLSQSAMGEVIHQTLRFAISHIEAHGDGFLEPRDDPFQLDPRHGVVFGLRSFDRTRRRLTYQELGNTATGILDAMIMKTKYNVAASFLVYDMISNSQIGEGYIGGRPRAISSLR